MRYRANPLTPTCARSTRIELRHERQMRRPVERSTGHIVGRHAHFAIESSIGWSVRSGGAFCGNMRAIIPLRLIDRLVRAKLEARQIAFRSLNHRKRAAVVVGSVARDLHSTRHRTREAFLRCLTVAGCTMATSATMPGKLGSIDPEQPDPFVSASDRIAIGHSTVAHIVCARRGDQAWKEVRKRGRRTRSD